MERRLSQKAAQMRQRLFTRHSNNRGRAATMTSPAPATSISTSSIRSRSATTPVSSTTPVPASDSIDVSSRHYHFTDEPGYYRPTSPLINRQEIEEDLEDNVKHSCALLVESIERGLPIWPSFHIEVKPNAQQGLAQAPTHETRSNLRDQMTQLSLSPVALDNLMIPTSYDWDSSARANPYSPPSKYGRVSVSQNSFPALSASAGTCRFYGRRLSTSPESRIDETEEDDRGRARGRSFGTDTTSPRSRSRSRSSSLGFFPYSPPQLDTWERDATQILELPDEQLFPTEGAFLGAEGITWLRASLDQNSDHPWVTSTAAHKDRGCMTSAALGSGTGSGPAPRRFYSTRRANPSKDKRLRDWDAFEVHGSRESGIYRGLSMRDLSMDEERKRAHEISYPVWGGDSDSADNDVLGEPQTFYSVDGMPARQRRKRASELLKKLTGLGTKRKAVDVLERRAVDVV